MFTASRTPIIGLALLFISGLVCTSSNIARAQTANRDTQTHTAGLTDVLEPLAVATTLLGEEWRIGKQIASAIINVVKGEPVTPHPLRPLRKRVYGSTGIQNGPFAFPKSGRLPPSRSVFTRPV